MTAPYVDLATIHDPTPGVAPPSTWGDGVRDDLEFAVRNKAHCGVYNSANISIANATFTAVAFDSERVDVGGMHSTSSNTSRLVVPADNAGWFDSKACASFTANATANRFAAIRLNGSTYLARQVQPACTVSATSDLAFSRDYQLIVGDYLELVVEQDSGGALNLLASTNYSPEMTATWRAM